MVGREEGGEDPPVYHSDPGSEFRLFTREGDGERKSAKTILIRRWDD